MCVCERERDCVCVCVRACVCMCIRVQTGNSAKKLSPCVNGCSLDYNYGLVLEGQDGSEQLLKVSNTI